MTYPKGSFVGKTESPYGLKKVERSPARRVWHSLGMSKLRNTGGAESERGWKVPCTCLQSGSSYSRHRPAQPRGGHRVPQRHTQHSRRCFRRPKLQGRQAGSSEDGQPCLRSVGLQGQRCVRPCGLRAPWQSIKKFFKQPEHIKTFCSCLQWRQEFSPRIRGGAIGGTRGDQLCKADGDHRGLTALGRCRLRSSDPAKELPAEEIRLLETHQSWAQTRHNFLLRVILTWEGSSAEHRSARRTHRVRFICPRQMLRLVWRKCKKGKCWGGERSQRPAGDKRTQPLVLRHLLRHLHQWRNTAVSLAHCC